MIIGHQEGGEIESPQCFSGFCEVLASRLIRGCELFDGLDAARTGHQRFGPAIIPYHHSETEGRENNRYEHRDSHIAGVATEGAWHLRAEKV